MYNRYELNGNLFEDRETVQRALWNRRLSQYEKEQLVNEHNYRHIDAMTTDTCTNMLRYDIDINKY